MWTNVAGMATESGLQSCLSSVVILNSLAPNIS
jgi:hypothetical protein